MPHLHPLASTLVSAALLAGCSDGSTMSLALHASGASVLAIQPAGERWQEVPVPSDGEATVSIAEGPFVIASVCESARGFAHDLVFGGPGNANVALGCGAAAGSTVKVSLDAAYTVSAAVGPYQLVHDASREIAAGTYDVLAFDGRGLEPVFEIRRDVSFVADTVLSIDLTRTGHPFDHIEVATDALATEVVSTSTELGTASGAWLQMRSGSSGGRALRVPASELRAGDYQTLTAWADDASAFRTRSATRAIASAGAMSIPLPAPVSSVVLTWGPSVRVAWESAGEWTSGRFTAWDAGRSNYVSAYVAPEWVAATGSFSELELDLQPDVPAWQPRWTIPAAGATWELTVAHKGAGHEVDQAFEWGSLPADAGP